MFWAHASIFALSNNFRRMRQRGMVLGIALMLAPSGARMSAPIFPPAGKCGSTLRLRYTAAAYLFGHGLVLLGGIPLGKCSIQLLPNPLREKKGGIMASMDHDDGPGQVERKIPKKSEEISAPSQADGIQLFDPLDLTKEHIPGASVRVAARTAGRGKIAKSNTGRTKIRASDIPYDQFLVGHFLRYVKLVIHDIMRTSLKRTEVKSQLQGHIKREWSAWVQRKITKKHLLNSIVRFVVFNCPQAKASRIDLVRDFPGWCEAEFGLVTLRRTQTER